MSGTSRSHTRLRAAGQGAWLDRRGRAGGVRASAALLRRLDREAANDARAERERQAAEPAERAERAEHSTPQRPSATNAGPPRPSAPPPWPTQAEIDGYVDRLVANPDAPVAAELWERFAAHEPSKGAQERAMGTVVDLVATAWAARRAGS